MIFLEIISNEIKKAKTSEKVNKKNSIAFKYMNVLGYFLPDSKTLQRNQNNFGAFQNSIYQDKKVNSFNKRNNGSEIIKNTSNSKEINRRSRKFTESSDENSLIIVNDDESENNSNSNSKKNLFRKRNNFSTKEDDEEISSNNSLKNELYSISNLSEKLSIYVRQNDLEKVQSLLSQYTSDLNDCNVYNNKKASGIGRNSNENSQGTADKKTCYSFHSLNNSSILNNNICEILNKNGWNAIHYSSFLGYDIILDYIINKSNIKPNPNILNNEG